MLQAYKSSLKPLVVEEWVDLLIYRPLGFLIALPLVKSKISPNQVTFISALCGIIAAIFILQGDSLNVIYGALFYLLSNILDCTDGQLARLKQQFSPLGRIFDGIADYVVGLSVFLAIAIALRPETYTVFQWWMLVGFGGILFTAVQGFNLNYVRQDYLTILKEHHDSHVKNEKNPTDKKEKPNLALALFRFYTWAEGLGGRNLKLPEELVTKDYTPPGIKFVLVLWTFTGKGTHTTLLGVFLLFNRPDLYCWTILTIGNVYILLVWIIHVLVLKHYRKKLL